MTGSPDRTEPSPRSWTLVSPDIPGALTSCILLTILTVLIAAFANNRAIDSVLRPLYFVLLLGFFHYIGRREPEVRVLPFRLVECGLLVLALGFATSALLRAMSLDAGSSFVAALLVALDRGAVFLLGLTLVSYGIILWLPQLLEAQRILQQRYAATKGRLRVSEKARTRMERRFVEADRLHAVGQLAAGVAHDLRNPLAIIKASAHLLHEPARTPGDIAEHSAVICRNIDRAERTIQSLLELGNPHTCQPTVVEVDVLIDEVCGLLAAETRRCGVTLECQCDPEVTVKADAKLIEQVLLNLTLNALQASPRDNVVKIVTRAARGTERPLAIIAIEDNGAGIEPQHRGKLFTPFFTTKPDGTGLGLLSSKRIMDELGGRIGLYPRTAGGVRALLILPLANDSLVSAGIAT